MTFQHPKLLFIDSYDSFTHNLAALCRQAIPDAAIYIIKNDHLTFDALLPYLQHFSAIIVGPGPGSPDISEDIGIVKDLWRLQDQHLIPIFGVCLGLQSLALEFGALVKRLNVVKHGQVSQVHHTKTDIFEGVGGITAVRYHSLHVQMNQGGDIEELAWADDGLENGHVVMGIKHKSKPFWAVQYHPESVCTAGGGLAVIRNFWRLAEGWSSKTRRMIKPWNSAAKLLVGPAWPHMDPHSSSPSQSTPSVSSQVLSLPDLTVTSACELLGSCREEAPFVMLDSAAKPGRFSIIASLTTTSPQITHFVGDAFVRITSGQTTVKQGLQSRDIWSWLAMFMRRKRARGGAPEIPFWGGFIGYLSYELGVHGLDVPLDRRDDKGWQGGHHPDVSLVFVERSVVLDSQTGKVHVQSICPDDEAWIAETSNALTDMSIGQGITSEPQNRQTNPTTNISIPDKDLYISRIVSAKEHLFAGDSYELCLTAQTRISLAVDPDADTSSSSSSWERYKRLRKNNPAPHSAYIRLHPTTLLSSSPERFLSFSRPPGTVCQLRPIKGTIRKGPGVTRAAAEQALAGSVKEVAENLMIVDLIRHDLHGVLGEDVQVKQFCKVEEYETVWQLVSVIEGKLPDDSGADIDPDGEVGWQVLQKSFPPGSMTGAPKKRSVEILQSLEDSERGIYSGVFGYWDVGGGGDWSVTIRSCYKYDDRYLLTDSSLTSFETERSRATTEEWAIGAGGAITALSDTEAEWDEMLAKLESVLRAFGMKA